LNISYLVLLNEIVMKQVAMWDDYKTMKRIKNKGVVV